MNKEDFDRVVNETVEKCKALMVSKGGEYAHGEDRFDNFKRNARGLQLTAFDVWYIYFHKHLDAITTYVVDQRTNKTRERSEPITGRIDDAINYLILLKGMVIEYEQLKKVIDPASLMLPKSQS